ncbi:ComEC/Rec2 family competence protein [Gilvibacter sediminis]|uniref:ComEC/Rec2 family competence protein n=1 Tax=Gilvibacter sediminis TaxID=379071 RepID=UPI00234FBF14|nr:ComEC/Rec2 family competence protein [Gilvibacter sediminis]MDC7997394.1 ComEC/Rec2 family competence protein [Gilvibacter sediminis]
MEFLSFPLVRLGLFFLGGILLGDHFNFSLSSIAWSCFSLLLLLCTSKVAKLATHHKKWSFSTIAYALSFGCGLLLFSYTNEGFRSIQKHHLKHYQPQNLVNIEIDQLLSETAYYVNYKVRLNYSGSVKDIKALLKIKKRKDCFYFQVGTKWQTKATIQTVEGPKNPADFNYAKYLKYQHIALSIKADASQLLLLPNSKLSIGQHFKFWQNHWALLLQKTLTKPGHSELLAALLLGYKAQLKPETKSQFAQAGIAHILAVSGLHLGIIALFASWILGPFKRLPHGRYIHGFCVLCSIWVFALFSGASTSVLRAATMFSFLIAGKLIGRSHGINSLFVSLWILLLIDPFYAFQVGFQLSYLAVFFILWLLPKWTAYSPVSHPIGLRFWQWIGLSIIAQLGTAPLSLYYFHEFPTYFLLSNLIVVPLIGSALIGGLLCLGLLAFWPAFELPSLGLNFLAEALGGIVEWVGQLPASTITMPYFGIYTLTIILLSSLLLGYHFAWRSKRALPLLVFVIILTACIWHLERPKVKHQLILSEQFGQTTLWQINGRSLAVFSTDSINESYSLKNFKALNLINTSSRNSLPAYFKYKGQRILVVDGSYPPDNGIKPVDILILTQNAKVHLSRWIRIYSPKLILCDGSSYANYKECWARTAKKERLPFYDTSQQGAFVFE